MNFCTPSLNPAPITTCSPETLVPKASVQEHNTCANHHARSLQLPSTSTIHQTKHPKLLHSGQIHHSHGISRRRMHVASHIAFPRCMLLAAACSCSREKRTRGLQPQLPGRPQSGQASVPGKWYSESLPLGFLRCANANEYPWTCILVPLCRSGMATPATEAAPPRRYSMQGPNGG